MIKFWV